MSFGRKSKPNNSYVASAAAALRPQSYSDPYGSFSNGVFTPNLSPEQTMTDSVTNDKLLGLISGVPTDFSANDLFNNAFYDDTANLLKGKLDQQRQLDTQNLDNTLSARNQLGSSYDALLRSNLQRDYNQQYLDAENTARGLSADAALNTYQAGLQGISTLRNDQAQARDITYLPLKYSISQQQAVAPLQTALAGVYNNALNNQTQLFNNQNNASTLFRLGLLRRL